jgi:hypothetical protein
MGLIILNGIDAWQTRDIAPYNLRKENVRVRRSQSALLQSAAAGSLECPRAEDLICNPEVRATRKTVVLRNVQALGAVGWRPDLRRLRRSTAVRSAADMAAGGLPAAARTMPMQKYNCYRTDHENQVTSVRKSARQLG